MDNNTCRRNLTKLNKEELKSKLSKRCHWGFSNLSKAEMINLLIPRREGEDESQDGDPLKVLNSRKKDLTKICKERKIKYVTCMTKQQMIDILKWNDEDPSVTVHPDTEKRVIEYKKKYHRAKLSDRRERELDTPKGTPLEKEQEVLRSPNRKELMKICKERKIKYATCMRKHEMIEVLKWNDEDSSVNVHPDAQKRVVEDRNKYREKNPDQREKAKECSRKWRINNPEKAIGHLKKWGESSEERWYRKRINKNIESLILECQKMYKEKEQILSVSEELPKEEQEDLIKFDV